MRMEHDKYLRSSIESELDHYEEAEQAVILNQFLTRLKRKRDLERRLENMKEVWRAPYVWLIIAGGVALPVLLYVIFIWSSLQLEA